MTSWTPRGRCWCGSRAASSRPTRCPSRGHPAPADARRATPAGRRRRRPAPRASRSPCTPRRASRSRRRPRGRRVPARPSSPGYVRARLRRLRRLVRGGRARSTATRATRSTASTSAAARGRSGSSSTARCSPRPRARGCCSRRSLPTRFYLPREDVAAALAPERRGAPTARTRARRPTGRSTPAAEDIAWSYEDPLPRRGRITGLVAFWDERVDVFFDGALRAAARAARSPTRLADEFGVETSACMGTG